MTARLIFTADDFGRAPEVNAGVVAAARDGVLTAASLMVGEEFFRSAASAAGGQTGFASGLHLTLIDGRPCLSAARIPDLVRADGRFRDSLGSLAAVLVRSAEARRQLRAEIEAQFAAFRATGLDGDHVNAHRHAHLLPIVADAVCAAAADAGVRCIRVPWERSLTGLAHAPLVANLRRVAARHGLVAPDRVVGLAWSGRMTAERVLHALRALRPGVTELYVHPATGPYAGSVPGYRYAEELAALTDPRVAAAVRGIPRGGYRAMLLDGA